MTSKVPNYTVYLLHFDEPVGKTRHYLGICKPHRLHWRMLEHRNSRGAALTARAAAQGTGFTIANTWSCDSAALERDLKKASHFERHCQICINAGNCCIKPADLVHYPPLKPRLPFNPLDGLTGDRFSRYRK